MKSNKPRSTFWFLNGWLLMDRWSTKTMSEKDIFEISKDYILRTNDQSNDCNAGDSLYRTFLTLLGKPFPEIWFIEEILPMIQSKGYERFPNLIRPMSRDQFIPMLCVLSKEKPTHAYAIAKQFAAKLFVPSKHGRGALQTPDFYLWVQAIGRRSQFLSHLYIILDALIFPVMMGWNAIVRAFYDVYFKEDLWDVLGDIPTYNEYQAGKLLYPSYAQFLNCLMYHHLPNSWLKRTYGRLKAKMVPQSNIYHRMLVTSYKNKEEANLEYIISKHIPTSNELTTYWDLTKPMHELNEEELENGFDFTLQLKLTIAQMTERL